MLDEKEKGTKSKFSRSIFSTACEKSWDSGAIFDVGIAKGFHL